MRSRVVPRFWLLACVGVSLALLGASKVRDDAPTPIRDYLTRALEQGKKEQPKLVEKARKAVTDAENRLAEVRKDYRKRKATDQDLQNALAAVETAKAELKRVQSDSPLKHFPVPRFDAADQVGTLPHGFGVSRVVSKDSALVYPFVEKHVKSDEKLFKDNASIETELVPTAKPLLLTGVDTAAFKAGERIPANPGIYQTGAPATVDDVSYQTLKPVDIAQYLEND